MAKAFGILALFASTVSVASTTCDNTTKYYPSFAYNGSYLDAGFDVDYLVIPNSKICIEQPLVDPYGVALSARYYCSTNGTRLHYEFFNKSACDSLVVDGVIDVPTEVDGTIIDCVCEKSSLKSVKVQNFMNESAYSPEKCSSRQPDNDNEINVAHVLAGTCFGYNDDSVHKSMFITCNDNDEAEVLSYTNSWTCESSSLVSNTTYSDSECINMTLDESWSFSCSGGLAADVETPKGNTLNADDVVFLALAFAYLVFVIILLSVMFCYMTGKICVKRNKVGIEPVELELVEEKKEDHKEAIVNSSEKQDGFGEEVVAQESEGTVQNEDVVMDGETAVEVENAVVEGSDQTALGGISSEGEAVVGVTESDNFVGATEVDTSDPISEEDKNLPLSNDTPTDNENNTASSSAEAADTADGNVTSF